jgi:AcrR family transcriptional regulator
VKPEVMVKPTPAEVQPLPARRVPKQERGRARVEAILDAAEIEFSSLGYDSATTEAIAARAGASIGSLYQFFPNKHALFDAVSRRYLDRVRSLFDAVAPTVSLEGVSWEALLDGAVDAFWALDRDSPAFSAVWIQGRLTQQLVQSAWEINREMADRADQILAYFAPHVPKEQRRVIATVVVEAVSGLLFAAARATDGRSPKIIAETKRMLRAYLREVLAASEAGAA